jgi:hypothetical protein
VSVDTSELSVATCRRFRAKHLHRPGTRCHRMAVRRFPEHDFPRTRGEGRRLRRRVGSNSPTRPARAWFFELCNPPTTLGGACVLGVLWAVSVDTGELSVATCRRFRAKHLHWPGTRCRRIRILDARRRKLDPRCRNEGVDFIPYYAIAHPGRKSGFRAGFWQGSVWESLKIGLPAGRSAHWQHR